MRFYSCSSAKAEVQFRLLAGTRRWNWVPAFAVTLALSFANPAQADDSRIAKRAYKADEVVLIPGKLGVQASIAFRDDEHIENVAIGDSNSWQVTPNKRANMLFVKPLESKARTNLTVVTDRHSYYFDLVAGQGGTPLYVLRFAYPNEPKAVAPALQAATQLTAAEQEAAEGEAPVDPAALNFAWATDGSRKLLPARIFDDGSSTYLSWSAGAPVPAILTRNEKGEEGPVNFAVRGDVIIVDGVPGELILRSGKDKATLENRGPVRPAKPATDPSAALAAAAATQTAAR